MSIDVRGVTKRFGDFVALDDVTVTIPSGGLTALLGPSGGGKSTLLRVIAGLESADSGSVHIEGVEATKLPPQPCVTGTTRVTKLRSPPSASSRVRSSRNASA